MVCRGVIRPANVLVAQLSLTASPTCRRLTPDFALFPTAIGFTTSLSFGFTKKREVGRYRPIGLADDTWGTDSTNLLSQRMALSDDEHDGFTN
jgi:hypothetical protein